jgi:hypothetical protein
VSCTQCSTLVDEVAAAIPSLAPAGVPALIRWMQRLRHAGLRSGVQHPRVAEVAALMVVSICISLTPAVGAATTPAASTPRIPAAGQTSLSASDSSATRIASRAARRQLQSRVLLAEGGNEGTLLPPITSREPILGNILRIVSSVTGSGAAAADMRTIQIATGTLDGEVTSLVFDIGFAAAPVGTKLNVRWLMADRCQGDIDVARLDGKDAVLTVGCAGSAIIAERKTIATVPVEIGRDNEHVRLTIDLRALPRRAQEHLHAGVVLDDVLFTTWADGDMGPSDSAPERRGTSYSIPGE